MVRLYKKVFIVLSGVSGSSANTANVSNFTICICLNKQPCIVLLLLI